MMAGDQLRGGMDRFQKCRLGLPAPPSSSSSFSSSSWSEAEVDEDESEVEAEAEVEVELEEAEEAISEVSSEASSCGPLTWLTAKELHTVREHQTIAYKAISRDIQIREAKQ
jgi:hypothetical protein